MRHVTGTLISEYHICHRRMWLHAHEIRMEHTSDIVYEGKLIGETTYPQRAERYKEIELDGVKIDFYDPYKRVVHEIKKSDKKEDAHEAQVKYYLYILKKNGIDDATGILEYPKLKKTEEVYLTNADEEEIVRKVKAIEEIIASETCPSRLPISKCKSCSYYEFCWVGEEDGTGI